MRFPNKDFINPFLDLFQPQKNLYNFVGENHWIFFLINSGVQVEDVSRRPLEMCKKTKIFPTRWSWAHGSVNTIKFQLLTCIRPKNRPFTSKLLSIVWLISLVSLYKLDYPSSSLLTLPVLPQVFCIHVQTSNHLQQVSTIFFTLGTTLIFSLLIIFLIFMSYDVENRKTIFQNVLEFLSTQNMEITMIINDWCNLQGRATKLALHPKIYWSHSTCYTMDLNYLGNENLKRSRKMKL